jgi:hypothetical protein
VVIFDDTWRGGPASGWNGKGGVAVPYLVNHGWAVAEDMLPAQVDDPEPDGSFVVVRNLAVLP